MSATACPHCLAEVPENARYCMHCARLMVGYALCRECREPIAEAAGRCAHCGEKVATEVELKARSIQMTIVANRIGAFVTSGGVTALFHPPQLEVAGGRVRATRWSLFGLRVDTQEIRFDRIASVKYTKGIFWGGLLIETFGGATEDLNLKGFDQDAAFQMAEELKAVASS